MLDCGLEVRKFELQSRYYDHFRINTYGKVVEPSYPTSFNLNSIPTTALPYLHNFTILKFILRIYTYKQNKNPQSKMYKEIHTKIKG